MENLRSNDWHSGMFVLMKSGVMRLLIICMRYRSGNRSLYEVFLFPCFRHVWSIGPLVFLYLAVFPQISQGYPNNFFRYLVAEPSKIIFGESTTIQGQIWGYYSIYNYSAPTWVVSLFLALLYDNVFTLFPYNGVSCKCLLASLFKVFIVFTKS